MSPQFSLLDTSLLNISRENSFIDSVINVVLTFEDNFNVEELINLCSSKIFQEERFKSTIINTDGVYTWAVKENLDMDYHFRKTVLDTTKELADKEDLMRHIEKTYGQVFDHSHPVWYMETFPNISINGNRGVVLFRIHHTIGDGASLTQFFNDMMVDSKRKASLEATSSATPSTVVADSSHRFHKKRDGLFPRRNQVEELLHSSRVFVSGIFAGICMAFLPSDSSSIVKIPYIKNVNKRQLAASNPIPISLIKEVKEVLGCTVNDVLMAALAGAINRYLAKRKENTDIKLQVLCLVNTRPTTKAENMENSFALLPLEIPVRENDVIKRIHEVNKTCDDVKSSPVVSISFNLSMLALKLLPVSYATDLVLYIYNKYTVMYSNVQGPAKEVQINGQALKDVFFFTNTPSGTIFCILSYNGHITITAAADYSIGIDLNEILQDFTDVITEQHAVTKRGNLVAPSLSWGTRIYDIVFMFGLLIVSFVLFPAWFLPGILFIVFTQLFKIKK